MQGTSDQPRKETITLMNRALLEQADLILKMGLSEQITDLMTEAKQKHYKKFE